MCLYWRLWLSHPSKRDVPGFISPLATSPGDPPVSSCWLCLSALCDWSKRNRALPSPQLLERVSISCAGWFLLLDKVWAGWPNLWENMRDEAMKSQEDITNAVTKFPEHEDTSTLLALLWEDNDLGKCIVFTWKMHVHYLECIILYSSSYFNLFIRFLRFISVNINKWILL